MKRKEENITGQLDFYNLLKRRPMKEKMEAERKAYNNWIKDIVSGLVDIGFNSSDARDMAANYTGMYYSASNHPSPEKIIRIIMRNGKNIYALPEEKLREYERKTGEKLPIKFSTCAR